MTDDDIHEVVLSRREQTILRVAIESYHTVLYDPLRAKQTLEVETYQQVGDWLWDVGEIDSVPPQAVYLTLAEDRRLKLDKTQRTHLAIEALLLGIELGVSERGNAELMETIDGLARKLAGEDWLEKMGRL